MYEDKWPVVNLMISVSCDVWMERITHKGGDYGGLTHNGRALLDTLLHEGYNGSGPLLLMAYFTFRSEMGRN